MKRFLTLLAACAATTLLAQLIPPPQPIDWRYTFMWDDPNPPGSVSGWTAYASNTVSGVVRQASTRVPSVGVSQLLVGQPNGTYALYNTATGPAGDVSEASTNLVVQWFNKPQPGKGLHVEK